MEMFSGEEVNGMSGLKQEGENVEVTCGCTSHRYGDAVGTLRVFPSGDLRVSCQCIPGCNEADNLTPAAFEKHSGRETAGKWKNTIWVMVQGEKTPLAKTSLLKYYNKSQKRSPNGSHHGRQYHRDEFVRCSSCNKERRFRLRTKEECRVYHDAVANRNWQCSDLTFDKITCEDEEERASRKVLRGCLRSPSCKGCTKCVCFGCKTCRFSDCSCQTCVDFTHNNSIN
ncbi:protein ULTRAPETALA 1-like protein [Carex littledalei]|uniref:Protein ULTRAPETALA 1-like protein n=1 Tax=Carex littledalei TaxID=544730 RepID=A0A833R7L4_9POAL|nr:protein ULTRAPETALA 1-like protein [Carex littledalei]